MGPQRQKNPAEPMLLKDDLGRIISLDKSNGISFDFSEFDQNGHATVIRITNHKFDDWDEWRQEEPDVWRVYHKGQPDERVLRGNWRVDAQGEMYMVAPGAEEKSPSSAALISAPPSIMQDACGAGEIDISGRNDSTLPSRDTSCSESSAATHRFVHHGALIQRVFELLNQTSASSSAIQKTTHLSAWMQRYHDSTAVPIGKWSNPLGTTV